jgi:hypothetical protein
MKRAHKIMSFYAKYLEANFINDTCSNDLVNFNSFAYDVLYYHIKKNRSLPASRCPLEDTKATTFRNYESSFLNNTAVLLVDLNLYASYANQLLRGSKLNNHDLKLDKDKPQVLLVDYKNESLFVFDNQYNPSNLSKQI